MKNSIHACGLELRTQMLCGDMSSSNRGISLLQNRTLFNFPKSNAVILGNMDKSVDFM